MTEIKLEDAPAGVRAYHDKGVAALERGNLEYAMDMFAAALEIEPRLSRVRGLLRSVEMKAVKAHPPGKLATAKAMSGLMRISALLKKDPPRALETAEKLLRVDPTRPRFIKAHREAALAAEMPEVAIQTLEIVKDNQPPNLAVLEPLAELYLATENFEGEYECRDAIVKLKPTNANAQKELKDAAARLTMGKAGWRKAERFRDVARKSDQPLDELEQARAKVEAEPNNPTHLEALADAHARRREFAKAIETLEKRAEIGGAPDPRIERKILAAKEQLISFEMAEAQDADDRERVAQLRRKLGETRIENAARQVERYPNDLQLKFEYGKMLFDQGDLTNAIAQLQQARRNPQRRVRALLLMAKAFEKKGQLDIARDQLETALEGLETMDETKKEVLYELGALLQILGDADGAARLLKEIYSVDIGYRDVATRVENGSSA